MMNPSSSVATSLTDQSVAVSMQGRFPTPLLAVIGVTDIEISTSGRARSLIYQPTLAGPIVINPAGGNPATFEQFLPLDFPLLSTESQVAPYELLVRQGSTALMGYAVEACNGNICHPMNEAGILKLSPVPFGQPNGSVVYGESLYDLSLAGVGKSSTLRLVDDAVFDSFSGGVHNLDSNPLVIDEISMLGFSAVCPANTCSAVRPSGLVPIQ